jgi:hypothetical protein
MNNFNNKNRFSTTFVLQQKQNAIDAFISRFFFFIKKEEKIGKSLKSNSIKYLLFISLFCCTNIASAQIPDSMKTQIPASDTIKPSFPKFSAKDSLRRTVTQPVKISKDALEEEVIYSAKDSMKLDAINEVVYLYGEAEVKYTTITLKAGYIVFDMANDLVYAEYVIDSSGQKSQKPLFTEGQNEAITAEKIRYNFVSKKGMVYKTTTTQAGGYVNSGVAKIVGKQDSIENSDDVIYGKDAIYTTCNHEHPHYGLRSSKQKVIPNKLVVIGPSNIEVMGIPTPLWLPFGFFPLTEGQSTGLIFPQNYESSPTLGYGLTGVGWYFGLGEYADLQLVGDIYTRGSWGVRANSRYKKRYKYTGGFGLGFSRRITGDPIADGTEPQNAFSVQWNHSQDSKANPTQTFRANVNMQTNGFQSTNFNDSESVLQSELTSNVSYQKRFAGTPFSLSASFGHRQNTQTHVIRFNLPTLDVSMRRIFPFQRKKAGGKEQWYEKIGIGYTGKVQNTIIGNDTLLNQLEELDFSYGAKHSVPVSANFKLFKYINVSPFVNYNERWYLKTLNKTFDNTITVDRDTIFDSENNPIDIQTDTTFGEVLDITENGFRSLRELSTGVSFNTQLFGMLNFKRGPIKAIRHIAKPSVSFSYTPDYTGDFWGYWDEVQYDTRYPDEVNQYNIFQGGLFGQASQGGAQSMNYSITNIFEAKIRNRRDTINPFKKVKLLNNLSLSGNYNFAADSLKMSVFNISGNTTVLKRINLSFGLTADPLAANTSTNSRIDTYEWAQNRRLARMTNFRLSANTKLDSKFFDELFGKKPKPKENTSTGRPAGDQNGNQQQSGSQSNYGILNNLSVNYTFALRRQYVEGVDSMIISQNNIRLSGGTVNLTTKWKVTIGGIGYDFVQKTFTYPDFRLYRNLHCWEMGFSWQPQRGTYSFYVRVKKPSQLDFLNLPYNRNNFDPLGGF